MTPLDGDEPAGPIDNHGEILIITGPPGAGKTTIARLLSATGGADKVHLHADDFWRFLGHGSIAPYLPAAHHQNEAVMEALSETAAAFARNDYFVIADGIIGPWFLHAFDAARHPIHYIILRPALDTAIDRCRGREAHELADEQEVTALYRQFQTLRQFERHVLTTEGLTSGHLTKGIAQILEQRTHVLEAGEPSATPVSMCG